MISLDQLVSSSRDAGSSDLSAGASVIEMALARMSVAG
jgi:hypothetical protein